MTASLKKRFGSRNVLYSFCACLFAFGWINGYLCANAQRNLTSNAELAKSPPNSGAAPVVGYTLPFTSGKWHGGAIVRLRLNDKVDADFLIDTGSTLNYISPSVVKALGLTTKPLPTIDGATARLPVGSTESVRVERVSYGAMVIDTPQFFVSDYGTDFIAGRTLGGIIGKNILEMFAVLFDFERNELILLPGGKLNDKQLAYLRVTGGTASGIAIGSDPKHGLLTSAPAQVEVNKHTTTLPFLVDTGSPSTDVFDPQNALRLSTDQGFVPKTEMTNGKLSTFYIFPLTSFAAGERAADRKQNRLTPFECGLTTGTVGFSLIGLNYLSHFRVLIDYPAEKMYLTPVTNPKHLPFPTESSRQCAELTFDDLLLLPTAEGKYIVLQTDKDGTFGKAGVQGGDLLETINGKKPDGLLYFAMTTLFQESGDKPAVVQLRRDGKIVQVSVELMPKK